MNVCVWLLKWTFLNGSHLYHQVVPMASKIIKEFMVIIIMHLFEKIENSHPLVHSPYAHYIQVWAMPNPGDWNSIQFSKTHGRGRRTWCIILWLLDICIIGKLDWTWRGNSKLGIPKSDKHLKPLLNHNARHTIPALVIKLYVRVTYNFPTLRKLAGTDLSVYLEMGFLTINLSYVPYNFNEFC